MQEFGPFTFDPALGILRGPEGEIRLRPKTYALLALLIERAPGIVSRDELIDQVWGREHLGATSLAQAVSELRRVLGEDSKQPRYIETVHGRGYRFLAGDGSAGDRTGASALPSRDEEPEPEPESLAPLQAGNTAAPRRARRPAAWLAVTLGSAAVIAGLLWLIGSAIRPSPAPNRPLRLAVVPLGGAIPQPPWQWRAMPELLGSRLVQHDGIYVYPPGRVEAMLRDLEPGGASDACPEEGLRYLQADHLLCLHARPMPGGRWRVELSLLGKAGSAPLGPVAPLRLGGFGEQFLFWETETLRALGVEAEVSRASRRPTSLDPEVLEAYYEAERLAAEDPRAALALLQKAKGRRSRPHKVARRSAELLRRLGEPRRAEQAATRARAWSTELDDEVWYLSFTGRPAEALALLEGRAERGEPRPELWLDALEALAAQDPARALAAFDVLPKNMRGSWLEAELGLLEARAARDAGERERAGRAAGRALEEAEETGHRETARQAQALLDAPAD